MTRRELIDDLLLDIKDEMARETTFINKLRAVNDKLEEECSPPFYSIKQVIDTGEQFIAYKYEIALGLKNNEDIDAAGWIKLILKNITEITVMDIQNLWVAIPAQSALEANYTIWFGTGLDIPGTTEVIAEVVDGQIPDQVCGGTGKISLNA